MTGLFNVGDVISFGLGDREVPPDLRDKYFRVRAILTDGSVSLDGPFVDEACAKPYRPDVGKGEGQWLNLRNALS